eukprot:1374203-Amorphochlora_amoeboformis.AAC.2
MQSIMRATGGSLTKSLTLLFELPVMIRLAAFAPFCLREEPFFLICSWMMIRDRGHFFEEAHEVAGKIRQSKLFIFVVAESNSVHAPPASEFIEIPVIVRYIHAFGVVTLCVSAHGGRPVPCLIGASPSLYPKISKSLPTGTWKAERRKPRHDPKANMARGYVSIAVLCVLHARTYSLGNNQAVHRATHLPWLRHSSLQSARKGGYTGRNPTSEGLRLLGELFPSRLGPHRLKINAKHAKKSLSNRGGRGGGKGGTGATAKRTSPRAFVDRRLRKMLKPYGVSEKALETLESQGAW